jgi:Tfp pilus assembly protein PilV
LVEVVLALAICSFVLVAILGLFSTGVQSSLDSEQRIKAANLASTLISLRMASPTNDIPNLPNFAIPTTAMTNQFPTVYPTTTTYVGADGQTTTAAKALYQITCEAGTNTTTGSNMAQIYLVLSWPPQAKTATAQGRYELFTEIPFR